MDNTAAIKKLTADGLTVAEIAAELGISRQRIYQIVNSREIAINRAHSRRQARPPKARLITGGVEVAISHSVAGTVAELLVTADLMARGWEVYRPILSSRGYDAIATRDGCLIRVEVRSAHRNASGAIRYARKYSSDAEHHALVITGEPVHYEPPLP